MIRCRMPVCSEPPDMIVFMTRIPESAEVTRNVMISTTHITLIAVRNGPESIWPMTTNSFAVFVAPKDGAVGTAGQF